MKRLLRLFGFRDLGFSSFDRTLLGLRTGDQKQLFVGLGLAALNYLSRTKPHKRLIYRESLPKDAVIIIHHKPGPGEPKIEVIKPT